MTTTRKPSMKVKVLKKSQKTEKVHYSGFPCGVDKVVTNKAAYLVYSLKPDEVTCKKCCNICIKIASAWQDKIPKQVNGKKPTVPVSRL